MPKWHVFQWGDGSQEGEDRYNIGCEEHEATVASDLPREVAEFIVECHNADIHERN